MADGGIFVGFSVFILVFWALFARAESGKQIDHRKQIFKLFAGLLVAEWPPRVYGTQPA